MTNPTESVEDKIDEVLKVLYKSASMFTKYPDKNDGFMKDAKAGLLRIIQDDVIGEDEETVGTEPNSDVYELMARNVLRGRQRSTLSTKGE